MRKRLFRAGAVTGAGLSGLVMVVGGVTETAFAAPNASAPSRTAAVQHPRLVPEDCGVVPVKTVVMSHGKEIVVTTWNFACVTFKPPQPTNDDLPPAKH
ncbi:hypothetical protein ACWD6P_16325 [Streptomyces sp. NPDC002446]